MKTSPLLTTPSLARLFGLLAVSLLFVGFANASSTVQLAWDANTEADLKGYRIHYGTSAETLNHSVDAGAGTTGSVSGLEPGVYYFAASAYNTAGVESPWSNVVSHEVVPAPAVLAWDTNPEPDIAGYRVHYGSSPTELGTTVDVGPATTFALPDLSPGVTYYFATTAYNEAGEESTLSELISYTMTIPGTVIVDVTPTPTPSVDPTVPNSDPVVDTSPTPGPGVIIPPPVLVGTPNPATPVATTTPEEIATPSGSLLRIRANGRSFRVAANGTARPMATRRPRIHVRGKVIGTGPLTVVYRVRNGQYFYAEGDSAWNFTATLRPDRNQVEIVAVDAGNVTQSSVRLIVNRKPRKSGSQK